jgi:NitT/TauT family transport system substrate-binding protein
MRTGLCVSILLLAGCGTAGKRPVRIVTIAGISEIFPVYLCSALGYFHQEGVETSIEGLGSGSKLVEALVGGSADVALGGYLQTVQMALRGRPLRSFFVSSLTPSAVLVVSPSKAERIRRVEDLKGATVDVVGFGGPFSGVLALILQRHRLRVGDVTLVASGSVPAEIAAIERSKVDAGVITSSAFELLRRRTPGVRVLADPRTREGMAAVYGFQDYATLCLFSTPDWISRSPEVARRMVRAMRKTHAWIQAHTAEEVLDRLPAEFRSDDKEVDLATLRSWMAGLSSDGKMPAGAPENVLRLLSSSVEGTPKVDLAETWTNEFVEAP